jgi:hypothetical protein|tara:strand:+ start:69 stop:473 length:405 start_codon:yes stop_codon:yes gene_type:complete
MELSNWEKWKRSLELGLKIFVVVFLSYVILSLFTHNFSVTALLNYFLQVGYKALGVFFLGIVIPLIISKRLMYTKHPLTSFLVPILIFVGSSMVERCEIGEGWCGLSILGNLIWAVILFLFIIYVYSLHVKRNH